MSEETTTETVLYEIARRHQSGNYIAIPATKVAESKHGADWLWWFGDRSNGIGFRVQAKRLFPSGRYESLFKKTGDPHAQLKKLVSKASKANHVPLYCFYNFKSPGNFVKCNHQCMHDYRAPSYWGCSIALPQDIKSQNSDSLIDLQGFMLPWHLLVCTGPKRSLADAAINAGRMLADTKPRRKLKDGRLQVGRQKLSIKFAKQTTPLFVRELIEIQERSRPIDSQIEGWREINARAQEVLEEEDIAGLTIFNDTRL